MSNNCLVTKLKSSVDANLSELGMLKLKYTVSESVSDDNTKKQALNWFMPQATNFALSNDKDFEIILNGGNAYFTNSYGYTSENYGNVLSLAIIKQHPSVISYRIICDASDNVISITIKNKYYCPVINGDLSDYPEYNDLNLAIGYFNGIYFRNLWNFDGEILEHVGGDLSNCIRLGLPKVLIKPSVTSQLNPNVMLSCILEDGDGVPYNCLSYNGTVKKWTLGSRQNATFVGFGDGVTLSSSTYIDNFLIDLATCHDSEVTSVTKKIQIYSDSQPTSDSAAAIQTLKEAGYTSIKVGNTEYITE